MAFSLRLNERNSIGGLVIQWLFWVSSLHCPEEYPSIPFAHKSIKLGVNKIHTKHKTEAHAQAQNSIPVAKAKVRIIDHHGDCEKKTATKNTNSL